MVLAFLKLHSPVEKGCCKHGLFEDVCNLAGGKMRTGIPRSHSFLTCCWQILESPLPMVDSRKFEFQVCRRELCLNTLAAQPLCFLTPRKQNVLDPDCPASLPKISELFLQLHSAQCLHPSVGTKIYRQWTDTEGKAQPQLCRWSIIVSRLKGQ